MDKIKPVGYSRMDSGKYVMRQHEELQRKSVEISTKYKKQEKQRVLREKEMQESSKAYLALWNAAMKEFKAYLKDLILQRGDSDNLITSVELVQRDITPITERWLEGQSGKVSSLEMDDLAYGVDRFLNMDIIHELDLSVGFWGLSKGFHVTPESLVEIGWNQTEEAQAVVTYMGEGSTKNIFRGFHFCEICNQRLGDRDVLTPDCKWMFPGDWGHYITEHSVKPNNEEFIKDAVAWHNKKKVR